MTVLESTVAAGFDEVVEKSELPDFSRFVRNGDRISLQGVSNKYLFDLDARNRDELDVVMSSQQPWTLRIAN